MYLLVHTAFPTLHILVAMLVARGSARGEGSSSKKVEAFKCEGLTCEAHARAPVWESRGGKRDPAAGVQRAVLLVGGLGRPQRE